MQSRFSQSAFVRMSVSYYEAGMNASPFSRFRTLLRLRRLREPPSMPPGRPSQSEVGAGVDGSGRRKQKGWLRDLPLDEEYAPNRT